MEGQYQILLVSISRRVKGSLEHCLFFEYIIHTSDVDNCTLDPHAFQHLPFYENNY